MRVLQQAKEGGGNKQFVGAGQIVCVESSWCGVSLL